MFNQEQLAAIAAAVSILQQSMQSNPTNSTPQNSSSTSNATTSSSTNNGNNQLAAIQQQLAEAAAAAVAASQAHSHMNQNHHNHHHQQQQQQQQQQQHHQQHHHLQQQHSQLSDVNFDHRQQQQQQQQSRLDGLTSMAVLKAALPIESEHHMQHLPTRHSAGVAPGPQATTTPITSTSQQNHLLNQLRQQYNRSDLGASQPSSHYPAQLQLDEQQQQILLNHLRVLQQPVQDSHHLNNILPEFNHQHHQEHQGLLDQYQSRLRDLQQLSNLHLSAPLSPNRPQAPMAPMEQRQQPLQQQRNQLKPEHDQQQATVNNQAPTAAKPSRPISYSAIVAKSAGLNSSANNTINQNTHTNVTTSSLNNDNVMSGTNSGNIVSQNKFRNMIAMNNTFGDGSNHVNSSSNSSSPFSGASNSHSIAVNPESMSKYNNTKGTSSINGHASRATTQQQQQHFASSNSIVRNALNNHVANTTNIDIFNTNSHTGSSLAHTNGSSLLKRNSNNLLSLEPSLDGYHTDYPISPAQQLFNQQNNSFRHNQVPNPTYNHQQNQNNNHSSFNTDIVFNTNSRDKGTPTYGRATNLLGFMGLYVGNLSPDLSKEQLEKLFSKYGEPVKAHRLIRSPVAFIKYENTESPRAAIDDLYGLLLPELTLNPDQPLKLHFDRNDAQLKANYRPTELPKEDNGECYGWRTTVCKRGKSCPKKHIPINRGIDFQMWMIKSNSTSTTGATTSTVTPTLTS